jgi:hypothetical protein
MISKTLAAFGIIALSANPFLPAIPKGTKAQEIVDRTVDAYGGLATLVILRQTGQLRGLIKLYTGSDNPREGEITIRFMRRFKVIDDLKRIDLKLPPAPALTLAYNGERIWGAEDGQPIVLYLRTEAAFRADLVHNYETLLRYRELGRGLKYVGREKRSGIELDVIDLVQTDGPSARYYVSVKTSRILHLEYSFSVPSVKEPVRVRESFYDFRVIQNTLAPFRVERYEDDHLVQETRFNDVTFGVQIEKPVFEFGSPSPTPTKPSN